MKLTLARSMSPLLRRHGVVLTGMLLLGLLAALFEGIGLSLFIPLFHSLDAGLGPAESAPWFARLADGMLGDVAAERKLPILALAILGLVLLKNALVYLNSLLYSWAYARVGHDLRTSIVDTWLNAPIDVLEARFGGELIDTLKTQSWETIGALLNLVTLTIQAGTFVIFLALLLLISWPLTLLAAVSLLGLAAGSYLLSRRAGRLAEEGVRMNERLSQQMIELVRGMRTVRLYSREDAERRRFEDGSQHLARLHMKRDRRSHLIGPLAECCLAILLITILLSTAGIGADYAVVLTFIFVLYRMYPYARHLAELRFALREALEPVRATMAAFSPGTSPITSGSIAASAPESAITFDSVSFRYDGTVVNALDGVSIAIPSRKTTALVGPSGAGKSTLVHLLVRFFEPQEGEIRIDERPLRDIEINSWRQRLAVVSQDICLFNTTIRENIALGKEGVTDAEIEDAARQAYAHTFIEAMPFGYDTMVGDDGARLSGGQRQRIALARALVRKPDLIVLDEATNALDGLAEQAIQEAIAALAGRHTIIVIAHRLSTIRGADQIIVLDRGQVVQHGPLGMLAGEEGLFRQMFADQQRPLAVPA